jgi:hypothetical protein
MKTGAFGRAGDDRASCRDCQSAVTYGFVYVDEESLEKYHPTSFQQLVSGFREYQ